MQETLQDNDLLIVSKVPKTISKITHKPYIPPRYQIIIFSKDEGTGLSRQLVKRVIALPGERVVVKNGSVTVFNQSNPNGFNPDVDQEYSKTIKNTPGLADLQVGENQVFVLGDNRLNSLDSRNFGTVEANSIVGKLGIRIFPLNKARTF
jgi:signal peptidase I